MPSRDDSRWQTHTQWFCSFCGFDFWWPTEGDDPPVCLTQGCKRLTELGRWEDVIRSG